MEEFLSESTPTNGPTLDAVADFVRKRQEAEWIKKTIITLYSLFKIQSE